MQSSEALHHGLLHSLLDEAVIRYRQHDGKTACVSLPQLFIAMGRDELRDFPALRPHQRHPWHAFLTQLASIALFRAGMSELFATIEEWREALLNLTPDDPDGAAWCLVAPPARAALLQSPVPDGLIESWKSQCDTPDQLDMLITSKNHDLKAARMRRSAPEDWLFALVSLQTQEGFLGAGNYGVSRMNGGFASRPGVGVIGNGGWGKRWHRDVKTLLATRARVADRHGLNAESGIALTWLLAWDGNASLAFDTLDPHYIEVCRRIRLQTIKNRLCATGTGSKAPRVAAKEINGVTGDPWTPVDIAAAKALTITGEGFPYKLISELLFGNKFLPSAAQDVGQDPIDEQLTFLAQGITRGQGKTERYHERRVPISPKTRALLLGGQQPILARIAGERIAAIAEFRKLLWIALAVLFNNGKTEAGSDNVKDKATRFARPFEQMENQHFFDNLSAEVEAEVPSERRLAWLLSLADRAEIVLRAAFDAGPRNAMQRYRAQSGALSRFHGTLRGGQFAIAEINQYYQQQTNTPPRRES